MVDRHGEHKLGGKALSRSDEDLIDRAWEFVIRHQGAQNRKGTKIPYTSHLRGVARRVLKDGGTAEEAVAGLLHDIVEDTPVLRGGHSVDLAEIHEEFGPRVGEIVDFCTDAAPGPGESKAPWRGRKAAHFENLAGAGPGTLRVVAADKTDNITGQLKDFKACKDPAALAESMARFKGGFAGTLWYYRGMRAAMGDNLTGSKLYAKLTKKISKLAAVHSPGPDERVRVGRCRMVLDALDPVGMGPVAVANGYYGVDAAELGRRVSVPGAMAPGTAAPHEVVRQLVWQWYDRDGWSLPVVDRVAHSLRRP